ncbi:MAG: CDP-diacylglycerol--glycerol-3-phosphate 3-phosphatidyltransferase, partial [Terriglobales bacterium]
LLIAVLFSTLLANKEIYGTAIFLAAAITDLLDGYLARRRHQITTLGILLDPIADKLLMAAAFISLVQLDPALVPAWMVVIILGREFAVTGLRSIAATQGFTIAANEWGKAKMVSQVVAVCIIIVAHKYGELTLFGIEVNVRWLGKAALWIVVVVALVSASTYFLRFWRQIDDSVKRRQRGLGGAEAATSSAPPLPAPAPLPSAPQPEVRARR